MSAGLEGNAEVLNSKIRLLRIEAWDIETRSASNWELCALNMAF
ncbi:hypothetical protein CSC17_5850 [Klebsiella oxytoca]|nr:hypothetical protein CSC17_5850 [Klebsiella oxytoca]